MNWYGEPVEIYCWEKDRNIRRETYPLSPSSVSNSVWTAPGANVGLCVEKQMLTTRIMARFFFLLGHVCPSFWISFHFETPNNVTAVLHVRPLSCTVKTVIKHFFNTVKHNSMLCIKFWIILRISGFGGLGVACWPLVPKFAGSNPAEAVGFLRAKKFVLSPL